MEFLTFDEMKLLKPENWLVHSRFENEKDFFPTAFLHMVPLKKREKMIGFPNFFSRKLVIRVR